MGLVTALGILYNVGAACGCPQNTAKFKQAATGRPYKEASMKSEYILNLIHLKEGEKEEFETISPGSTHVSACSSTVTPEPLAADDVLF